MITLIQNIVIDTNVIIHLEKAKILDIAMSDSRLKVVDLVYYKEYKRKDIKYNNEFSKIERISLNEKQLKEALIMHNNKKENSFFDYACYIAARDNDCILLTGDWKLKDSLNSDIEIHGAIWYAELLFNEHKLNREILLDVLECWVNDDNVYMPKDLLREKINSLKIKK